MNGKWVLIIASLLFLSGCYATTGYYVPYGGYGEYPYGYEEGPYDDRGYPGYYERDRHRRDFDGRKRHKYRGRKPHDYRHDRRYRPYDDGRQVMDPYRFYKEDNKAFEPRGYRHD
jgi:hypothetical protein